MTKDFCEYCGNERKMGCGMSGQIAATVRGVGGHCPIADADPAVRGRRRLPALHRRIPR